MATPRKKSRDIIVRYTDNDTAEVIRDDEVVWSGYMPNEVLESLSDILESLDFEVDLVPQDFDNVDDDIDEEDDDPAYEDDIDEPDDE